MRPCRVFCIFDGLIRLCYNCTTKLCFKHPGRSRGGYETIEGFMDNQEHDRPTLVGASSAPTVEITRGENIGQTFTLTRRTRLGRERDNDIVLLDPKVSRYHALITDEAGQWVLTDLGSSNHTYLNGQIMTTATTLQLGDRVGVGETELTFSLPGQSADKTAPATAGSVGSVESATPAPVALATRSSPPRLAWAAGGFVLLLCMATVIVLYLVSRMPGGEGAPTAVSSSPLPGNTTGVSQPVSVVEPPADLTLAYEDDFSNSFGGWDDAFDASTTKQYGNNRYQIEVSSDNLIAWGLANRDVADFELEVDAKQEDGAKNNSYGLLFRVQDRDNFYRFDISGDGFYLLSKFLNGEWVTLVDWTYSSLIKPDINVLKISAFGPDMTVWVNGQPLTSVKDDSFSHGNFGFFASTFGEPYMWVSFDNLKVWTPQGQQLTLLPTATPPAPPPSPTAIAVVPPTPASDTIVLTATVAPTESVAVSPLATPTLPVTPTVAPTPTPVPLPEYASRDQPLARGEEKVSGRIIFPVFDSARGTYDIYIADAATGANRQLVQAEASQPALNLDGTQFAYRSWQPDKRGLFARLLAGGDAWQFDPFFESARPQFSPADNSLMYHSRSGGKEPAIYRVINGVGQVMRREGFPIQGLAAKWSPDGQEFVYSSCLGGSCGVILSNIDGSNPLLLSNHPSDTAPEISPDGSTVVFMSKRGGNWEIYRVSITGGDVKALTADDASDGLPTWSPDGEKIAFVANRDGEWAIWDMNPDGTNQRRLFVLGGSIDGQVQTDPPNSFGWVEENIDWAP